MKRAGRGVAGALAMLFTAGAAAAQGLAPVPPAADSARVTTAPVPAPRDSSARLAADSLGARADSISVLPDSLAAIRDSVTRSVIRPAPRTPLRGVSAPRRTPLRGVPAPPPDPPLQFTADNMTGSHGPEGDEVLLNGNLRITRGRSVLTAERGRFLQNARMLFLDGRVKMVDSSTTVTCDHATYAEATDVLQLDGNVVVVDREATLRSPAGTYDRRRGAAHLYGGVEGRDREQRILCDQATYQRDSLVLRARGNVHGFDDENRVEIEGRAVDYDRRSFWADATGDPVLRVRDDEGRPSEVRALRLRLNNQTRYAEALDSVRVVRDSLHARADLARFDDAAGRGWLTGSPRAWDPETVVSGDTLELWSVGRKLERMVVRSGATVDYTGTRPGAEGEMSRLTGQRIDAFVTRNALDSLVAVGGARNDYTAAPRPGRTAERNLASGDTITVFFKDRKIDMARVTGEPSGEYSPPVNEGDTLAASRERIRYDAKRIEFEVPRNRIVLDETAHLIYRDLELRSQRVEYDVDQQTLVASGMPELLDRGDQVKGHMMTYDLDTRIGTIYQAQTAYERGLYRGEAIRKVSDEQLDVNHGSYTTCSLEHPHYHFSARWMKIYLKDKLVAKPVVFYLRNVPVFALPFWVFPIKPGRHSGFLFPQFEFGLNSQAGQFIRNAGYYWAPNEYMDFTGSGDYYQAEPSWVLRGEGVYKKLYVMDGVVRGTFARNERLQRDDYDVNAQHFQELTPRTRVTGQASFVSSRDYSTSNLYGRTIEQRLNRFLTSSLAFSHNADWAGVNAVVDRRQDLDADASIQDPDGAGPLEGPAIGTRAPSFSLQSTLPSLSIGFPTRTLGSIGFLRETPWEKRLQTLYLSYDARFVDERTRRGYVARRDTVVVDSVARAVNVILDETSARRAFGSSLSMSDSRRAFGWLNLSPRFDSHFAIFDFDEAGNEVVPAASWSAGVSTSTTFYGLFRPTWGPITGIRHVVFPNASFSYSPEIPGHRFIDDFGVSRPRFTSVGGIGVSSFKQAFLSFGLDQRLQVKLKQGEKVQRLDNLVSMSLRSTYNLLWREQRLRRPLSPIAASLQIQPPGALSLSAGWVVDPYEGRPLRNLSLYSGYTLQKGRGKAAAAPTLPTEQASAAGSSGFAEDWSVQLAYSYAGGYGGKNWESAQTLNGVGRLQFSPGWSLEYSSQVDLVHRRVGTQRYGLVRDLHCWTASFTRTFNQGGETEYYFKLGVKDLKELYVERGTRTGSIGGIQ